MSDGGKVYLVREGKPTEALQYVREPQPTCPPDKVLVRVRYCPINPADGNVVEGTYGIKPPLPSPIGAEGAGEIVEVGAEVSEISVGQKVVLLGGFGCWQEYIPMNPRHLYVLPEDFDLRQGSMLRVNPLTASCLLENYVSLKQGDWIVQNAANSGVGRAVNVYAAEKGWAVLNLVRRPEHCEGLGEHVFRDDDESLQAIVELLGKTRARLGLNAVGGESSRRVARLLGVEATHLTYGAMGRENVTASNAQLIFKRICFTGFWLTEWLKVAPREHVHAMLDAWVDRIVKGTFSVPIAKVYPAAEIVTAMEHSLEGDRGGKILIEF